MYVLAPILRRPEPPIELSTKDFDAIVRARKTLQAVVGFEQNFALLVDNYVDYERELLELALQRVVRPVVDWQEIQTDILGINRRLANLLSSARLYLDQLRHGVTPLVGSSDASLAQAQVETFMSTEYDSRPGYEVMEAIRNVVQHSRLAVHSIGYPGDSPGETKERRELRYRTVPKLSVRHLRDAGLKAAVIAKLEAKGSDSQPITPLVREYMEGLGSVHKHVRAMTKAHVDADVALVESYLQKAEARWPKQPGYLVGSDDPLDESDPIHLFRDVVNYLPWLVRNNNTLLAAGRMYVSSQSD